MIYLMDQNGDFLLPTNRSGHIRRLLKEHKAKVVKKNPFTVQLLYEVDTAIRPRLMEGSFMNIVLSKDNRFPIGLAPVNATKMTAEEFLVTINQGSSITFTNMYVDIDSIDKAIYDEINFDKMIESGSSIKFFRYDTKSYIKHPVEIVNTNIVENKIDSLDLRLSRSTTVANPHCILVCGRCGSGKTTFLKNCKEQYENKGVEVIYFDEKQFEEYSIEKLKELKNTIRNRTKVLASENKTNWCDSDSIRPLVIMLDGIYSMINDEDKGSIIKDIVDSCIKLDVVVGVRLIVTTQSIKYLNYNIYAPNRIILGNFDKDTSVELFNKAVDIDISIGSGLYSNIDEDNKISVFSIFDIKNLI